MENNNEQIIENVEDDAIKLRKEKARQYYQKTKDKESYKESIRRATKKYLAKDEVKQKMRDYSREYATKKRDEFKQLQAKYEALVGKLTEIVNDQDK